MVFGTLIIKVFRFFENICKSVTQQIEAPASRNQLSDFCPPPKKSVGEGDVSHVSHVGMSFVLCLVCFGAVLDNI